MDEQDGSLVVIGYACTLESNQAGYEAANDGTQLIAHEADDAVLVDRFDGRLLLASKEEFKKRKRYAPPELTSEEILIEAQCEAERYLTLDDDPDCAAALVEPQRSTSGVGSSQFWSTTGTKSWASSKDMVTREEERHRRESNREGSARAGIAIGFTYDSSRVSTTLEPQADESEDSDMDEVFSALEGSGLIPPATSIRRPKSWKQLEVIEKTAQFLASQNLQMEIMVKTKRKDDPRFRFLDFGNELNPFYKLVLKLKREGSYSRQTRKKKPGPLVKEQVTQQISSAASNNRFDHPSRSAPTMKPKNHLHEGNERFDGTNSTVALRQEVKSPAQGNDSDQQEKPDPDAVKKIIDKLAEYVKRNGIHFANKVALSKKGDPAYDFFLPWNEFHGYYKETLSKHGISLDDSKASSGDNGHASQPVQMVDSDKSSISDNHHSQATQDFTRPEELKEPDKIEKKEANEFVSERKIKTKISKSGVIIERVTTTKPKKKRPKFSGSRFGDPVTASNSVNSDSDGSEDGCYLRIDIVSEDTSQKKPRIDEDGLLIGQPSSASVQSSTVSQRVFLACSQGASVVLLRTL